MPAMSVERLGSITPRRIHTASSEPMAKSSIIFKGFKLMEGTFPSSIRYRDSGDMQTSSGKAVVIHRLGQSRITSGQKM